MVTVTRKRAGKFRDATDGDSKIGSNDLSEPPQNTLSSIYRQLLGASVLGIVFGTKVGRVFGVRACWEACLGDIARCWGFGRGLGHSTLWDLLFDRQYAGNSFSRRLSLFPRFLGVTGLECSVRKFLHPGIVAEFAYWKR